jgi:hypothetical protein
LCLEFGHFIKFMQHIVNVGFLNVIKKKALKNKTLCLVSV